MATLPPLTRLRTDAPTPAPATAAAAEVPELPSELWGIVLNAIDDENPCQAVQTLCRTNKLFRGWCAEDEEGGIFDRLNLRLGWYGELANWAAVKAHYEAAAPKDRPLFEPDVPNPATPKAYFAKVCRLRTAIASGTWSEVPNDVDPKWQEWLQKDPKAVYKYWKSRYPIRSVKKWWQGAQPTYYAGAYMDWGYRDSPREDNPHGIGIDDLLHEPFAHLAMRWMVQKDPRHIAAMELVGIPGNLGEKETELRKEMITLALEIDPSVLKYVPYYAIKDVYFDLAMGAIRKDPSVIEYVAKPCAIVSDFWADMYSIPPGYYWRLVEKAKEADPELVARLEDEGKVLNYEKWESSEEEEVWGDSDSGLYSDYSDDSDA